MTLSATARANADLFHSLRNVGSCSKSCFSKVSCDLSCDAFNLGRDETLTLICPSRRSLTRPISCSHHRVEYYNLVIGNASTMSRFLDLFAGVLSTRLC